SSEAFFRETSPSCFEPKAEKVIAFHGKDASYAYNVLADLKAAAPINTGRSFNGSASR
ncbi:hypothetical protein, partial [Klebsiella pneumoniae]|uniref:hypothetical protein n=1 Tax=Klebsiella pneumoniae TaxID=573 RepID=UPI0035B0415D